MPLAWNILVKIQPADGQIVWIRQLYVEYPVKATWHTATASFTVPGFATDLPWYFVQRWQVV